MSAKYDKRADDHGHVGYALVKVMRRKYGFGKRARPQDNQHEKKKPLIITKAHMERLYHSGRGIDT